MKIEIHAVAQFWIALDQDHVSLLKKAAEWHYDGFCNKAAQVGGFIYGWSNVVTPFEGRTEVPKCSASFRDLDLCMKILEIAGSVMFPDKRDQNIVADLRKSFRNALRMANEKMGDIIFYVE
jgi:hypothetical protein